MYRQSSTTKLLSVVSFEDNSRSVKKAPTVLTLNEEDVPPRNPSSSSKPTVEHTLSNLAANGSNGYDVSLHGNGNQDKVIAKSDFFRNKLRHSVRKEREIHSPEARNGSVASPLKENEMLIVQNSSEKQQRSKSKNEFKRKFYKVFFFPLLFLKLGGFGIKAQSSLESESTNEMTQNQCSKLKHVTLSYLPIIYRLVVGAIHMTNLGRIIAYCLTIVPKANESGAARYLVASIGMLYGTVIFLSEQIVLRLHFPKFVECIAGYESSFGFLNDIGKKQRRLKCITILVMVFDMFTAVGWDALGSENADNFVSFPFSDRNMTLPVKVVVHVIFCAFVFLVCIPVYGVLMFYTTILDTLRAEFKSTKKIFAELLEKDDELIEIQFDQCRQRYQSLCQTVVVFSRLTRGYVVVSFFFQMTSMFVSIFGLSSSTMSADIAKYQVFGGMAFNLLLILFLTAKWGLLHSAAHSITQAVNNAPWEHKSKRMLQKMSLLLAQCSTTKVGINVYGLFIIDTSTPLMVTGTLITYGVVVLQFQLDKESMLKCGCNITAL